MQLTFNRYQAEAKKTAIYPKMCVYNADNHFVAANWVYPLLGLTNEAGELAGKLKKVIRDCGGDITEDVREKLKAELGDVLWYLAVTADELGLSFEEIAQANLAKLKSRAARGKIQGSGDNR